jgi:PAS domain S-box-containing protein
MENTVIEPELGEDAVRGLSTRVWTGCALVIAILLAVNGFFYWEVQDLVEGDARVAHTHQVVENLNDLLTAVTDAESGLRGFLLSGRAAYLAPFEDASVTADRIIMRLGNLLADNAAQQQRLAKARVLIEQKFNLMKHLITLRRDEGFAPALAVFFQGDGLELMGSLRTDIGAMLAEEHTLLQGRAAYSRSISAAARRTVLIGSGVGSVVIIVAAIFIGRVIGALRRALARATASANEAAGQVALRETADRKLMALLNSARDAIVVIDREGIIAMVNPKTEEMFGYTSGELLGQKLEILIPRRFAANHPALRSEYFKSPRLRAMGAGLELYGLRKDGAEFAVEISLSPLPSAEGMLVSSVIRDVTETKRAAEELQRSKANLEVVVKELETIPYTISHDLRAPLRAIDGYSRILLDEYAEAVPPAAREYLDKMHGNARHMGALIDDLLEFSRLTRQELRKQPVDPAAIARAALDEVRSDGNGTKPAVGIAELPLCQADPTMLKRVFANLLDNALKYTRKRSDPVIEVGSFPADAGEQGYFVRDNGAGFDMRYAGKLFGIFQRLHRAEEYEGTGVGLAIAQRVVHRHGGRIWAQAETDKGATFYFTLPREGRQ